MSDSGRCRSCAAPIIWARTEKGKAMPLDAEPDQRGNCWFDDGGKMRVGGADRPDRLRYLSHFATCPQAATHRRPR